MKNNFFDYCIVGAGPSGLTLAYELLRGGKTVRLIERNDRIGGLAKSYNYGGHIFDTGPKRFHTDDPIVLEFIRDVLREDLLSIGRSTKVFFLNKYFTWPLQPKDLLRLPIATSIRCFFDLLKKREITDKESFHQFINSKYGETLYSLFFAPYTEKFLRWNPEDIHADWASTGINRTVIDKRIKANSLIDLVKSVSLPEKINTEFIYPKEGGFGDFYEKLNRLCTQHDNFDLQLSDQISDLKEKGTHFDVTTDRGTSFQCEHLVWSGNLNDCLELTKTAVDPMPYLNTVFYNMVCKDSGVNLKNRAQWIYVSRGDSLVSRITCMREFADTTCPKGYYNFICELTDSQVAPRYFKEPEKYKDPILAELEEMRFISSSAHVESIFIQPVVDTYPIYHRRFHKDFSNAVRKIKSFSRRIHLLGRSGAFWYNNSDHSIRMSIDMAKFFLGQVKNPLDYRSYFGGEARKEPADALPTPV